MSSRTRSASDSRIDSQVADDSAAYADASDAVQQEWMRLQRTVAGIDAKVAKERILHDFEAKRSEAQIQFEGDVDPAYFEEISQAIESEIDRQAAVLRIKLYGIRTPEDVDLVDAVISGSYTPPRDFAEVLASIDNGGIRGPITPKSMPGPLSLFGRRSYAQEFVNASAGRMYALRKAHAMQQSTGQYNWYNEFQKALRAGNPDID